MPMKVGLFTDALSDRSLGEALRWLEAALPEIEYVELGTGGYSPAPHCDRTRLLESPEARRKLLDEIDSHELHLAAVNVSGNPVENEDHDRALRDTLRLAPLLGVSRVVCMSGGLAALAGGGWFPDIEEETERYWQARVLPYWSEISAAARQEDAALRLCLELEPGSAVFNVSTFERIAALGQNIAVNLDPSHFFWQSIDPLAAVRRLGTRIGFAHGKDTVLETEKVAVDGVVDRSAWRYATVGEGHDVAWWRAFLAELRRAGYDGPLSIEYEDSLASPQDSIAQAARVIVEAGRVTE